MNSPKCVWRSRSAKTCPHHRVSAHTVLAIDDASDVLSKIEIAAWGPTLNKHHCAVLAAPGVNGILGARFATGLFRESNRHIPDDQ